MPILRKISRTDFLGYPGVRGWAVGAGGLPYKIAEVRGPQVPEKKRVFEGWKVELGATCDARKIRLIRVLCFGGRMNLESVLVKITFR